MSRNMIDTGESPLYAESVRFTYADDGAAGVAGVFTQSITVPAGAVIVDIRLSARALWNQGTSATMIVGDAADPDGFYTAVNLKATDLLAEETIRFESVGGKQGAYIVAATGELNDFSDSERVITGQITTVGTAATTGDTVMTVIFAKDARSRPIKTSTFVAT